jgi:phosphoribosylamine---glycine ligase
MDLSQLATSEQHCVGVVLATGDYPKSSTPLRGLSGDVRLNDGCRAFWSSSRRNDGTVDASGGRVLTVTALGDELNTARAKAYAAVKQLAGRLGTDQLTYRTDIGRL